MQREKLEVVIMGKVYTILGDENKDYLQKVASYLDRKMHEVASMEGYNRMSLEYRQLFVNLNVADDYFKLQEVVERLQNEKQKLEKELCNLKQHRIDLEIELNDKINEINEMKKNKDE